MIENENTPSFPPSSPSGEPSTGRRSAGRRSAGRRSAGRHSTVANPSQPTYSGSTLGYRPDPPTLRARIPRMVWALAFSSLLLIGALWAALRTDPAEDSMAEQSAVAVLEVVRGAVTLSRAGELPSSDEKAVLVPGEPILAGTILETGSAGPVESVASEGDAVSAGNVPAAESELASPEAARPGRMAIRLEGGQSVRLDIDSRARVMSASSLILERGAIYVDSVSGSGVEVRTSLGMVRDIGTQFEVRLEPPSNGASSGKDASTRAGTAVEPGTWLRVRVREGQVELLRDGRRTHRASAGEGLAVDGKGVVERHGFPIHGGPWDWTLDTAPVPDFDGRTLREFLGWLAREGGWAVRFAEPGLEARAAEVVLHGSLIDLHILDAANIAFTGSGLAYELGDGELWVSSTSDAGSTNP